ncbi:MULTISPECIES: DUF1878 family protein [Bacillus]|uniref:Uncharacterized protein n=1 Tax=Bacillus velezensis TaxID=492670 RepID=A0A411A9Q6_BACVE|nr:MULTISPECIES: DUF1878 family protein [Bacillus]APA03902.1 DUF1878 domain-containing protein [Bacillus velezensis]AVB08837.1 DUF1878 domain-containing protein [Bacillus velezensis]AXS61934.1 DUF1878 domain-containing protein [Bacillus velezensis]MCG1014926.1 DUF1878 family protein [Bacillus velezensis]MCR6606457.1 DUF1878 family protein [Bacillus velezensis]
MSLEKEVELLKYQNYLLKTIINGDDYPFFMFALDHNLNEKQVEATVEILSIFSNRLNGEKESLNLRKNSAGKKFDAFGIAVEEVFKNEKPTRKEFESYKDKIFSSEIETKYLLMSLQRQHIKPNVCEFLLQDN